MVKSNSTASWAVGCNVGVALTERIPSRPQPRVKLAQTARPTDAKQRPGLWTPAVEREFACGDNAWTLGWRRIAAAAGFARDTGVRGGRAPRLPFAGALRARAARRSKRQRVRPLGAIDAGGGQCGGMAAAAGYVLNSL